MAIWAQRLESGLRVALWPRLGTGTVSVSAWIGAGTADEPASKSGLAHFFEHMLFKGTAKRGVGEIASELESVGGDINAWTTFDNIVVQLRVPSAELARGVDVVSDMLTSARFEAAELELERGVVLDELGQAAADSHRGLGRALFSTVFRRHPYNRPILGTGRSIARITRNDLEAFGKRHVTNAATVIALAGDFEIEQARALVSSGFSKLASAPLQADSQRPRVLGQRGVRERVLAAANSESQLILAFPSPPLASRDYVLLDMISIALGQGASSVLARSLEGDLATSSGAYIHGFRDAGLFVATASAASETTSECISELAARVFEVASDLLSPDTVEMVKNAIISDSVYGRETVGGLAAAMGLAWSSCDDADVDRRRLEWAKEATAEDLREVARRVLRTEKATIAATVAEDRAAAAPGTFAKLVERAGRRHKAAIPTKRAKQKRSPPTRRVVLPSGAVVVIHRDDTVPLVAAQATWRGGLRLERTETAGIGALLAASISRGCGDRDDDEMARTLDQQAATLSGFSGRNSFGVRAEWLTANPNAGLNLLLDCIVSPHFNPVVVERERIRLADDVESRQGSPSHLAHRMFAEALYGPHPYALDPLGEKRGLSALAGVAAQRVRDHYQHHYRLENLTLAIVGDVDPDRITALLGARLKSQAKRRQSRALQVAQAKLSDSRERFAYVERSRAHLVVGFPGASIGDKDRDALELLAAILGGQGGRLFSALRERRGLVYRVAAHSIEGVDPGAFAVVTTCSPEHLDEALKAIRTELDSLRRSPVSEPELKRAVTFVAGTQTHAIERRSNLAAALAYAESHGLGYQSVFRTRKRLASVTAADLQRAASRFLRRDRAVISTVLPTAASPAVLHRARGARRKAAKAAARSVR